ncbi:nuclear transport factor 2 family protein [Emcibacter sp. SYSU 3D8]|uniref:nuclear transport factor 2 family protein n=1 Tax=Emcibacter sp. SYSU 3D8 TaxID=3133969 RepID=UPI0031FE474F
MQDTLNEIVAHHRIRQVLERYCRGIDRLDAGLIDSVYWDDATDNHGIYVGPGRDFSAFIVPMLRDAFTCTMHVIGQSNIAVTGDRAAADTYFVAYHTRHEGDDAVVDVAAGRYADMLERRGDEWRIRDRTVVMDWVETRRGLADAALALDSFTNGTRSPDDLSYDAYKWAASSR